MLGVVNMHQEVKKISHIMYGNKVCQPKPWSMKSLNLYMLFQKWISWCLAIRSDVFPACKDYGGTNWLHLPASIHRWCFGFGLLLIIMFSHLSFAFDRLVWNKWIIQHIDRATWDRIPLRSIYFLWKWCCWATFHGCTLSSIWKNFPYLYQIWLFHFLPGLHS